MHFIAQYPWILVAAAGVMLAIFARGFSQSTQSFPEMNNDLLLVEPLEVATTVRGMARPGAAAERPKEGIVRAVGPGRLIDSGDRIEGRVDVGDLIAFPDYAGKEIVDPRGFPPGAYLIVRESEVQVNFGPAEDWIPLDSDGRHMPICKACGAEYPHPHSSDCPEAQV